MGKLENWIAYQQRHLDPADFGEWIKTQRAAADAKTAARIDAALDRENRIPAAIRGLQDLQKKIVKEVMAPAIEQASAYLATIEKAATSTRTGVLGQAIGSTKAKTYLEHLTAWIASGPRRGYGRTVLAKMTTKGVVLKRQSKKFSDEHPNIGTFANPIKYAGFLIRGRAASVAGRGKGGKSKAKALFDPFTARFFGHSVKEAKPRDFMAPAEGAAQSAANIATCSMQLQLQEMFPDND